MGMWDVEGLRTLDLPVICDCDFAHDLNHIQSATKFDPMNISCSKLNPAPTRRCDPRSGLGWKCGLDMSHLGSMFLKIVNRPSRTPMYYFVLFTDFSSKDGCSTTACTFPSAQTVTALPSRRQ